MVYCLIYVIMNLGLTVCLDDFWVRFSKCYDTQVSVTGPLWPFCCCFLFVLFCFVCCCFLQGEFIAPDQVYQANKFYWFLHKTIFCGTVAVPWLCLARPRHFL